MRFKFQENLSLEDAQVYQKPQITAESEALNAELAASLDAAEEAAASPAAASPAEAAEDAAASEEAEEDAAEPQNRLFIQSGRSPPEWHCRGLQSSR